MRHPFQKHLLALAAGVMVLAGAAWASQEHVVGQKNKAFSVKKLTVKVGETVKFVNEDSFAHNVVFTVADQEFRHRLVWCRHQQEHHL